MTEKLLEEITIEEIIPNFIRFLKENESKKQRGVRRFVTPLGNMGFYDIFSQRKHIGFLAVRYDSADGNTANAIYIGYSGTISSDMFSDDIRLEWSKDKGRTDSYKQIPFP